MEHPENNSQSQEERLSFGERCARIIENQYGGELFTSLHWTLLALCLLPASLLILIPETGSRVFESLRAPLIHLSCLILGLRATARNRLTSRLSLFLILSDVALILCCALRSNAVISGFSHLIIPFLTALAVMMNARIITSLSPSSLYAMLSHSFKGLFVHIRLPFLQLFRRSRFSAEASTAALLSICVCIPVVLVVALFLGSADPVFLDCLLNLFDSPSEYPFRLLLTVSAALMLFSWLSAMRFPGNRSVPRSTICIPAVFPGLLLPMMNALYALFVCVQFSTLFGGNETAAMSGGYAEYARSGFFQLAAVAVINLAALAAALHASRGKWMRLMSALLIAATAVILFSAFWRMRLYILAYGLTPLRIMTLWGMLAVSALLVVGTVALLTPRVKAFSVGFICLIVLWVGLNAIDTDSVIARHNAEHHPVETASERQEISFSALPRNICACPGAPCVESANCATTDAAEINATEPIRFLSKRRADSRISTHLEPTGSLRTFPHP